MAVQTQIQTRRGTAASWTSTNPTLAAGEIGFESDTNKFKIGTGSTAWASLAYASNVSPLTTKGDLYTYSTDNTRLAVGANGETIVADSSTSTGLRWQGDYAAGKNKIINGDFRVAQRGTTFTIVANAYTLDRFSYDLATAIPTGTVTQETFTPGTAPVAGYEAQSFMRTTITANLGCTSFETRQKIEDVRTFAGQTITFSFYAKADAACNLVTPFISQNFGSGGSGSVSTSFTMNSTALTTGWLRYTGTVNVPSISGKTIGTNSFLTVAIQLPVVSSVVRNGTYDYWGWQLEAGSVATAFQTATGTIQGELAACQRYFFSGKTRWQGYNGSSTTNERVTVSLPVSQRTNTQTITLSGTSLTGYSGITAEAWDFQSIVLLPAPNATGDNQFWITSYTTSAEL